MASILFIDDDTDIRPLMNVILTRLGHKPTMAARGQEGLDLALKGEFDLVLMDLMMPDLDGYEVTRRLRANPRTRDLPVLIFTARSQPADQEGALQAGADGFLTKPSEPKELGAKISELLAAGPHLTHSITAEPAPPGAKADTLPRPAAPEAEAIPTLNCRVIVTLGLRGGVGATTFAVNLAGGLAQAGRRVCLVDLSPSGGLAALQLGLRPKVTWADLPAKPDVTHTGSALVRHISGLFILGAPPEPTRRELTRDTFHLILGVLDGVFADVVIRAAPVLDDATTAALQLAQIVFVVLNAEVGAVQTTIGTLNALKNLTVSEECIRIVLNQTMPEPGLSQSRVEKALGRPVNLILPYDRTQLAAFAQGSPLIFSQPAAPLAAAVQNFVAKL